MYIGSTGQRGLHHLVWKRSPLLASSPLDEAHTVAQLWGLSCPVGN